MLPLSPPGLQTPGGTLARFHQYCASLQTILCKHSTFYTCVVLQLGCTSVNSLLMWGRSGVMVSGCEVVARPCQARHRLSVLPLPPGSRPTVWAVSLSRPPHSAAVLSPPRRFLPLHLHPPHSPAQAHLHHSLPPLLSPLTALLLLTPRPAAASSSAPRPPAPPRCEPLSPHFLLRGGQHCSIGGESDVRAGHQVVNTANCSSLQTKGTVGCLRNKFCLKDFSVST